jgi:transcriptional regulator with XRE-family HTH domain
MNKIITYYEQLEMQASNKGVRLKDVCLNAGLDRGTYNRWASGSSSPSLPMTKMIFAKILGM